MVIIFSPQLLDQEGTSRQSQGITGGAICRDHRGGKSARLPSEDDAHPPRKSGPTKQRGH